LKPFPACIWFPNTISRVAGKLKNKGLLLGFGCRIFLADQEVKMKIKLVTAVLAMFLIICMGSLNADIYVSVSRGSNQNDGSRENPVKEIDRAITLVKPGEAIRISGGHYQGTFGIGYLESDKPLQLIGSYDEAFEKRSVIATPTLFQPDNAAGGKARKAMLKFTRTIDGTQIDGIVFNMGMRNAYSVNEGLVEGVETGRMLRSTERPRTGNSTVEEPIIQVASSAQGGDLIIRNCVFVNGAGFAIQGGVRGGTFRILNNVFVGNRMAAVEIYGTCASRGGPGKSVSCGNVEIAYNTILFTWSRLKDMRDMGYGIRVMTKCSYAIHHNIIGGSILAGIDHTRFNPGEWLRIEDNIFFANKKADIEYSPASNTRLNIMVEQFGDLTFAAVKGNRRAIPTALPLNLKYLEGFLTAGYSEQEDFNPDSQANLWREALGLNKQGKLRSSVSMFMNRYPWKDTLKLFGAVRGAGAQRF